LKELQETLETPSALETLGIKKLSDTELEFMNVIWAHPEGITSEQIYSQFSQALGTKSTILHRISRKGLVNMVRSGRHHIYIPRITKQEYIQLFFLEKLRKEFRITTFEGMIAAFCGRTKLKKEERERVQQLLEELRDEC